MRVHYLQHVSFEGPANIESWAKKQGWEVAGTHMYRSDRLPSMDEFDWLVIMGGPMNIYEEDEFPWLTSEKEFIRQAVESDKIVLGICLGAQLIADALGGRVFRNRYKEIGWFPVTLTQQATSSPPFQGLPDRFAAFHWHGDTFSLPPGAVMLAESEACPAQAYSLREGRVVGLQFHLESTTESVRSLIQNCADDMVEGPYVQHPSAILENMDRFSRIHETMVRMLENIRGLSGTLPSNQASPA